MKCGWCDREDGLKAVQVEPPQYTKRYEYVPATGETELIDVVARQAVMAMACPDHAGIVFDPSPNVRRIRRRKARGFQQSTIFDQLPQETEDRSRVHHGVRLET